MNGGEISSSDCPTRGVYVLGGRWERVEGGGTLTASPMGSSSILSHESCANRIIQCLAYICPKGE